MKDIRFALEDYMHFLKVERQLSGNTTISYKRDLTEYLDYMEQAGYESMEDVDRPVIVGHLHRLKDRREIG